MQLECINCALCIDACDDVMGRVGLPHGLIAYDTDLNIARRARGEMPRFQFIRSRTALYAAVLALAAAAMLAGLSLRSDLNFNVLRDRNPNFVALADGQVRNGFTLKIVNKSASPRQFSLSVTGLQGLAIKTVGQGDQGGAFAVEASAQRAIRLYVTADPKQVAGDQAGLTFTLTDTGSAQAHQAHAIFVTGKATR